MILADPDPSDLPESYFLEGVREGGGGEGGSPEIEQEDMGREENIRYMYIHCRRQ